MSCFVGHDLGTGGNKCVLVDEGGRLLASTSSAYPLHHPRAGLAEQDPEHWWQAVSSGTREVLRLAGVRPADVSGMAVAGQMLALVPVDEAGKPLRPAISWLDARATEEARRMVRRLGGERLVAAAAGAVPGGKDIVAKIAWLRNHEPEGYAATRWFLDATGFVVARATGVAGIDPTGAAGTGMLRAGTLQWSRSLAFLCGLPLDRMPPIRPCTEIVGPLTSGAAEECGLTTATRVVAGLGDAPAAAVGAGAIEDGDEHLYLGTSGWVARTSRSGRHHPRAGIFALASADTGLFLRIGETETAGACVDWLLRVLGLEGDAAHEELGRLAQSSPPGARGLLFGPWMFGERSPVPDAGLRGAFAHLSLEHGRADVVRAVYEGIALNLRWILDALQEDSGEGGPIRAIGGGTRSDVWMQILADVLGRPIERVANPHLAGAIGTALTAAVGVSALSGLGEIKRRISVGARFEPKPGERERYDSAMTSFRSLAGSMQRLRAARS